MTTKEKQVDFPNLAQTQNLLDLELHELRPILYPKLMHLLEIEGMDDQLKSGTPNEGKANKSLEDIYINENLIIKNRSAVARSLLDDRCIVGKWFV